MKTRTALDYDKYLRTRDLQATEFDRRAGGGVSATVHFRDRDEFISVVMEQAYGQTTPLPGSSPILPAVCRCAGYPGMEIE